MSDIFKAIHKLEDKLEKLLTNYEFLKQENEALLKNNTQLQFLLQERAQELIHQKKEFDVLRIAKTIEGGKENTRDTKLKINALIREIDKCIIQLNS